VDVMQLMQHLKEDMGLQVTYLSTLDEGTASQVRELMSQETAQVEELRIGENVKRRRRIAPAVQPQPAAPPEEEETPAAPAAPEEAPKAKRAKATRARVVKLPSKKAAPAKPKKTAPPPPPAEAPPSVSEAEPSTGPAEVAAETTPPAQPEPTKAPPIKKPKTRVKRKETPARIISLPPEEPVEPSEAAPPAAKHEFEAGREWTIPMPGVHPPQPPPKPETKGKKKGKKAEVVEMPAKGKPVKKREVRERADLYSEGEVRMPGRKRGMKKAVKKVGKAELTVPKAIKRRVKVGESITVGELAKRMGIKSSEIIKQLLSMGVMANINYPIDYDSAAIVASEFGFEVERAEVQEEDLLAIPTEDKGSRLWAMWTTARPRCWMLSGRAASWPVKPEALPSTSALIMWSCPRGT
jgi:translation initiation factor IF-2